jgi:hypothetical protein
MKSKNWEVKKKNRGNVEGNWKKAGKKISKMSEIFYAKTESEH